ncbi:MAG TPA: selenium cofactor biosynthesis protein YqeC [Rubrobacteraceae bacterium]|nr:selenium cofactor biosynthesis protein YqeC [Rubrobacteraceae bacterium]
MKLYAALGISAGDVVAFAGAGGKSSAILTVAHELQQDGFTALVAPTTKMFLSEADQVGPLVTSENAEELGALAKEAFSDSRAVVAGRGLLSKNRVEGVDPDWIARLAPLADVALVEADGSRRRPLKGTAPHEPVLPDAATLVVGVGNVEALGKPLDEEHIHRPEVLAELTGLGAGQSVTAHAFARALSHGTLGKVPPGARRSVLLTGVEPGKSMAEGAVITRELWRLGIKEVLLSSLPKKAPPQIWHS